MVKDIGFKSEVKFIDISLRKSKINKLMEFIEIIQLVKCLTCQD